MTSSDYETGDSARRRFVRPEYSHGPFAQIEYDHHGNIKMQYIAEKNVMHLVLEVERLKESESKP